MFRSFIVCCGFLAQFAPLAFAAEPPPADEPATLARIRDAAMSSDWAYQQLTALSDDVGPRLSGSPGAAAAVQLVAAAMTGDGLQTRLQPVKVPHWVRGIETGELVRYPGQMDGLRQKMVLTALGGSTATPENGLTANVMLVRSFEELKARAVDVPGKIVLMYAKYDQHLADNGYAGAAYGDAVRFRNAGPSAASALGAAAVLVRSAGDAAYRLPHTGTTSWKDGDKKIPCAALSAEDADRLVRLIAKGPVTVHLLLTPKTLPDADSDNVIADLPGGELANQVVIVSGHLDSWDLGTGSMDDGMGVTASMGAVKLLARLGLKPKRTVRFIAWMNEENGGRGGKAYFASVQNALATQFAAIESDFGLGDPLGFTTNAAPADLKKLQPLAGVLQPIGATVFEHVDGEKGADINPLVQAGVPGFEPLIDGRHYFDYHHTAADTLDKIDPMAMRKQVALLAVLAYALADAPETLQRTPQPAGDE